MFRRMLLAASCAVLFAAPALARNEVLEFDVDAAVAAERENLPAELKFYMHGQPHPSVARTIGTWDANRPAQSALKSDESACHRAFASSLLSLHGRALSEGGDAIIDITSRAGDNVLRSATKYRCTVGNILVRVALEGQVVKLGR